MDIPKRKIGVIVPCYNVEKYIDRCLESVAAQDCGDFVCVVINDGSTDSTAEHIKKYVEKHPEIFRFIDKPNGGISNTRNAGVNALKGKCEYLAFVDSDDFVTPDYLSSLYESAEKYGSDIVWGFNSELRNGKVNEAEDEFLSHPVIASLPVYDTAEFTSEVICDRIQSYVWAKLFRLSLFEGIEFPEGRIYEDTSTFYRLTYKAKCISKTEPAKSIYCYRINPEGIVLSATKKKAWQIFLANREQYEFSLEKNLECAEYIRGVMLSNALASLHCKMRGNEVPDEVLADAKALIKKTKISEIRGFDIPKNRKPMLIFAKLNAPLYMKIMKKYVK